MDKNPTRSILSLFLTHYITYAIKNSHKLTQKRRKKRRPLHNNTAHHLQILPLFNHILGITLQQKSLIVHTIPCSSVQRGSPFQVEVALAYGGNMATQKITRDELAEIIQQSDAKTLRKFLLDSFNGVGPDAAERIINQTKLPTRCSPQKLNKAQLDTLHNVLKEINISEGQSMQIFRFANRVPLQYQQGACAITQAILNTNWRPYGLSQSRGALPAGPVTLIVHVASVWVPFTSESKEAIANTPEIEKELRLGIQAIGRSLASFLRKRQAIAAQGNRRNVFLRYLKEVATAVASIQKSEAEPIYDDLLFVAKKKTAVADVKLDEFGKAIEQESLAAEPAEEDASFE